MKSKILGLVILVALAGLLPTLSGQSTAGKKGQWGYSTFQAEGISAAPFEKLVSGIESGEYGNIDRLIVLKNSKIILDKLYQNDYETVSKGFKSPLGCGFESCDNPSDIHDYNYFHPEIHPFYRGRDVHSLQSVTKSITATLIGIAIDQGKIASTRDRVLDWFEDYDLAEVDDRLKDAMLEDLLTMTLGMEWHENDRPLDETNTTLQLERSEDWIQFTLDQPMEESPGVKWVYNSGASHLMSGIIKRATGKYVDQYAEEVLFGPLGITEYYWKRTPKGYPDTEGGLFLRAEDLAKIGQLYLNDGQWNGQQILSSDWTNAATAIQVRNINAAGWGYGYQWWRLDRNEVAIYACLGFGGQYLLVIPEYDIVTVTNSWNVFGGKQKFFLGDLISAILDAAG